MKIFITISIFAMISAGAYGFIDMSRDVFQGTMINYHQTEAQMNENKNAVLDSVQAPVETGMLAHAGVSGNSSGEKMISYVMRSYSRGEPEQVKVVLKKSPKEDSTATAQRNKVAAQQELTSRMVADNNGK